MKFTGICKNCNNPLVVTALAVQVKNPLTAEHINDFLDIGPDAVCYSGPPLQESMLWQVSCDCGNVRVSPEDQTMLNETDVDWEIIEKKAKEVV